MSMGDHFSAAELPTICRVEMIELCPRAERLLTLDRLGEMNELAMRLPDTKPVKSLIT